MSRNLKRQEWWDHRRQVVGTVLLYLCFLAYFAFGTIIALKGLSLWWLATIVIPMYVAVAVKGDV